MLLLKNGRITEDPWEKLGNDDPVPETGPIIVSLARWQAEHSLLRGRKAPLGLSLSCEENPDSLIEDLAHIDLIALDLPVFTDGRAYSHARLLRERHGFTGELRATGHVLRDQFLFLARCGFNAFEVADEAAADAWIAAMSQFGIPYQPASDGRKPARDLRRDSVGGGTSATTHVAELAARYEGRGGLELLDPIICREFPGRIALVSSFGAEAAVLLALAAEIDPTLPVIFLETGKHFGETLDYRDRLVDELGLTDIRSVGPDPAALAAADQDGLLWSRNADRCCYLRKVLPLRRALTGFDAWITGRKRFQGGVRADLSAIEAEDGRVKINPLATWTRDRVAAEIAARGLPPHPLEAEGYPSIGCAPCTGRVLSDDADQHRAGRWAGREKTECGIHYPANLAALQL